MSQIRKERFCWVGQSAFCAVLTWDRVHCLLLITAPATRGRWRFFKIFGRCCGDKTTPSLLSDHPIHSDFVSRAHCFLLILTPPISCQPPLLGASSAPAALRARSRLRRTISRSSLSACR